MRVLALGDIFGRPGRRLIESKAAYIRKKVNADFVIANIENASAGKGVNEANANRPKCKEHIVMLIKFSNIRGKLSPLWHAHNVNVLDIDKILIHDKIPNHMSLLSHMEKTRNF